jgi:hypothetical protein
MLKALLFLASAASQPNQAHLERLLHDSVLLDRCLTSTIAQIDDGFMEPQEVSKAAQPRCEAPYVAFLIESGISLQQAIEIARSPGDGHSFLERVLEYRRMRKAMK